MSNLRQISDLVYSHLTDDGLVTGDDDMTVDGSSTPARFYIQPPAGETWVLNRMIFFYRMTGVWTEEKFGSLAQLSNGVEIDVRGNNSITKSLTASQPIKANAGWATHCYDVDIRSIGSGETYLVGRWTFTRDNGSGLVLSGTRKEALSALVQDNLSTMSDFGIHVRGYKL